MSEVDRLKVLFISATPDDEEPVDVAEEFRRIKKQVRASKYRDALHFETITAARSTDLTLALQEHEPDVVHFSGHGTMRGEIVLCDEAGNARPVPVDALKRLFSTLKGNIRLVVLNACYSEVQAKAILSSIDCVVGMNRPIGDDGAVEFAAAFYGAIGFGYSVQSAFDLGVVELMLHGELEESETPVLLARPSVDASELILIASCEIPRGADIAPSASDDAGEVALTLQAGGGASPPPSYADPGQPAPRRWGALASRRGSWQIACDATGIVARPTRPAAPPADATSVSAAVVLSSDGRLAAWLVDGVLEVAWINRWESTLHPWGEPVNADLPPDSRLLSVAMSGDDGARVLMSDPYHTMLIRTEIGGGSEAGVLRDAPSRDALFVNGSVATVELTGEINDLWLRRALPVLASACSIDAGRSAGITMVAAVGLSKDGNPGLAITSTDTPWSWTPLSAYPVEVVVVRELEPGLPPKTVLTVNGGVITTHEAGQYAYA